MEKIGGTVHRRSRSDVIDYQDERDAVTQAALKAAEGRAKACVEAVNKTIDTKIQAQQDQASKSTGEAKARLEQQIARSKPITTSRAKLHQAWQLTKEALLPPLDGRR